MVVLVTAYWRAGGYFVGSLLSYEANANYYLGTIDGRFLQYCFAHIIHDLLHIPFGAI